MKILMSLLAVLWGIATGHSEPVTEPMSLAEVSRYANAIWYAEGGSWTRFPYGIKSVYCPNRAYARQVCIRTIQHWWTNWQLAGKPGDFVKYLADTYCPKADDPEGHEHWIKNVHFFYKHPGQPPPT